MSFNFTFPTTASGFTPASTATTTFSTAGGVGEAKPSFFNTATTSQPTGFSGFGLTTTAQATTAPTTGFSGFNLSSATTAATGAPATATAAPTAFAFSTPSTGATAFKLTPTTATTAAAKPSTISFGPPATVAAAAKPTTSSTQFSLGSTTTPATTTTTATASFTPILGVSTNAGATTTTAAPLKIGSLTTSTATSTPSATTGISTAPTTTATTSTTATTIPQTGTLTYAQLEDSINKWTIDLEEQGKLFINQAKELNAWDNLLISNGEKILQLNETIERVKQQQKQLDHELDFVLAQQNELDELSLPLEKQLADIPIADQNRFQMYQLSEIIDSQLKQMSEDLKEIVEHLNESNKTEDTSDPVIQISRILNAHMNSLQWIDRNSTQITSHLEQISKLQEFHKKNQLNYN